MITQRAAWLDNIRKRAAEILPEAAKRMGLPEYLVISAHEILDCLLAHCGADPS